MKRSQPKRDWTDAYNKVHEEEPRCRICQANDVQAAHTLDRGYDQPKLGRKVLYVHPDSVIPLCQAHHEAYDAHKLSILSVLTPQEQAKAVSDAGSIEAARRRLDAPAFREQEELIARVVELESKVAA